MALVIENQKLALNALKDQNTFKKAIQSHERHEVILQNSNLTKNIPHKSLIDPSKSKTVNLNLLLRWLNLKRNMLLRPLKFLQLLKVLHENEFVKAPYRWVVPK